MKKGIEEETKVKKKRKSEMMKKQDSIVKIHQGTFQGSPDYFVGQNLVSGFFRELGNIR